MHADATDRECPRSCACLDNSVPAQVGAEGEREREGAGGGAAQIVHGHKHVRAPGSPGLRGRPEWSRP